MHSQSEMAFFLLMIAFVKWLRRPDGGHQLWVYLWLDNYYAHLFAPMRKYAREHKVCIILCVLIFCCYGPAGQHPIATACKWRRDGHPPMASGAVVVPSSLVKSGLSASG